MESNTNKIKWLIALIFAIIFQAANAQNIEIGLKSGINLAKLTYPLLDNQFIVGFTGGAFSKFKIGRFVLQPEVLYSEQGNSSRVTLYTLQGTSRTDNFKSIFNYLNLPIIAKYKFGKMFNVQAGPQLGFVLTAKQQQTSNLSYAEVLNANSNDFSFAVGLGADFPVGITVDARYCTGFTNVTTVSSAKNQVIQLSVGYRIIKFN